MYIVARFCNQINQLCRSLTSALLQRSWYVLSISSPFCFCLLLISLIRAFSIAILLLSDVISGVKLGYFLRTPLYISCENLISECWTYLLQLWCGRLLQSGLMDSGMLAIKWVGGLRISLPWCADGLPSTATIKVLLTFFLFNTENESMLSVIFKSE